MTAQSEVGRLQSLLLKRPAEAFRDEKAIESQWQALNYLGKPDFSKAKTQYEAFVNIFTERGVAIHYLPENPDTGLDSLYVRDASISTDQGMILCRMGKTEREGEPAAQLDFYRSNDIKVKGVIEGPGKLEGGDVAWIDEHTLGVARGYRTNDEGIAQLKDLVKDVCEEVIVFHSPHYRGPSDVFHLMSVFSPVDEKLAVIYSPLMPVSFRDELIRRGYQFIEVPDEEYDSLGCNVLALSPGEVVMAKGNPKTRSMLEQSGVTVVEYESSEISLKGCGGPTCLTRPLLRGNNK